MCVWRLRLLIFFWIILLVWIAPAALLFIYLAWKAQLIARHFSPLVSRLAEPVANRLNEPMGRQLRSH
jgi:hypothetical protein